MENVLTIIVNGLAPILIALVGWGTAEVAKYMRAKTKDENLNTVLMALQDAVSNVVTDIQHTQVQSLKDTGKFTADIGVSVKSKAMRSVLNTLTPSIMNMANKYINNLESYVSSAIEAKLVGIQENISYSRKYNQ
jgi:hypothetical protein